MLVVAPIPIGWFEYFTLGVAELSGRLLIPENQSDLTVNHSVPANM